MADFKKIKINNTTYNVKDEGAGRSLSVSGQDLSLKDGAGNVLSNVTLPGGGGGISKPVNNVQKLELFITAVIEDYTGTVKWTSARGNLTPVTINYNDTVLLSSFGGYYTGQPRPIRSNGKKYFNINAGDTRPIAATSGSYEFDVNEIVSGGNAGLSRDNFIFSIPVNICGSGDTNKIIHSSHYIPHLYMDTAHSADLAEAVKSIDVLPVIYDDETTNTLIDTNCDFFYKLVFNNSMQTNFPYTYTPASDQTVGRGFIIMREPVYSFTDAGYPSIIGMQENEAYQLNNGYKTNTGTYNGAGYSNPFVSNNKYFCTDNGDYRFVPMSIFN